MLRFFSLMQRYWSFILFVALEIFCIYLMVKSKNRQGLDILNSANKTTAFFYSKEQQVLSYFRLRKINNQLLAENARLHSQLAKNQGRDTFKQASAQIPIIEIDSQKLQSLKLTQSDTDSVTGEVIAIRLHQKPPIKIVSYAEYHLIPAKVISNSISNVKVNYLTINQGRADGVKEGNAVITASGVVGRVEKVSEHFATVASVLSNRVVSAKLLHDNNTATINWEVGQPDYVHLKGLPISIPVKKKDTVVTSEYSYFPANVMIGRVSHIDTNQADKTLNLKVKLSTNFRAVDFVYVVDDALRPEKEALNQN